MQERDLNKTPEELDKGLSNNEIIRNWLIAMVDIIKLLPKNKSFLEEFNEKQEKAKKHPPFP